MLPPDFRGSRRCVEGLLCMSCVLCWGLLAATMLVTALVLAAALTAGAVRPPGVSAIGGRCWGWQMARCFVALQLFCRLCALMLPLDNASSARVFGCSHSLPIPPFVREKKKLISNKLFFSSSLDSGVSVFTLRSLQEACQEPVNARNQ